MMKYEMVDENNKSIYHLIYHLIIYHLISINKKCAMEWGMDGFEDEEADRPEFKVMR